MFFTTSIPLGSIRIPLISTNTNVPLISIVCLSLVVFVLLLSIGTGIALTGMLFISTSIPLINRSSIPLMCIGCPPIGTSNLLVLFVFDGKPAQTIDSQGSMPCRSKLIVCRKISDSRRFLALQKP